MSKSAVESQARITANAERGLGRPLTTQERKAIAALDKRVVVHEVAEWDEKAVVQFLNSIMADQGAVKLLTSLGNRRTILAADLQSIACFFGGDVGTLIQQLDVHGIVRKLSAWLTQVADSERFPSNMRVLRFGLFECDGGFQMYVSDAKGQRKTNATTGLQTKSSKLAQFAPVGEISALWRQFRQAGAEPWIVTQALIIAILKALFSQYAHELDERFRLSRTKLLTGFDEGDDYTVRVNSGK